MSILLKEYRVLGKKGEGTFSEVLKCQKISDSNYYACKKMKQHYDSMDQVNSLREIQAMKRLNPHANIILLHDVIFDKRTGSLALILELMDMNVYELIRGRKHYLPENKVKGFMWQLCRAMDHVHSSGIFHRDVKPENILIKNDLLKLADFGSCRSVNSKHPYTEYISTRWYRAPECLLTDGYYSFEMDLWSVGCVIFEVMSLRPLFPGANEVDQINKVHEIMGSPSSELLKKFKHKTRAMSCHFPQKKGYGIERLLPHASLDAIDLIKRLCEYDPELRINSRSVLKHPYFREYRVKEQREKRGTPQQTPRSVLSNVANKNISSVVSGMNHSTNKENAVPPLKHLTSPSPSRTDKLESQMDGVVLTSRTDDDNDKESERELRKKRWKPKESNFHGVGTGGITTLPRLVEKHNDSGMGGAGGGKFIGSSPSNQTARVPVVYQPKGAGGPVLGPDKRGLFADGQPVGHHRAADTFPSDSHHQSGARKGGSNLPAFLTARIPATNRQQNLPSLFNGKYVSQYRTRNKPNNLAMFYGRLRALDKPNFRL